MSGALVPQSAQALSAFERERLDMVAHTLAGLHEQQALQFFRDYPQLLKACLQNHYPLTASLLATPGVTWDWRALSASRALQWDADLIAQFAAHWDWDILSKTPPCPGAAP